MHEQFTNGEQPAAELPVASVSDETDCRTKTVSESRARLRRIREHRRAALTKADPLAALLECVNSDLMELEHGLGRAVLRQLRDPALTMDEIEEYRPAIDLMLRATKQIAQNRRLESDLGKNPAGQQYDLSAGEGIASCAPTRNGE